MKSDFLWRRAMNLASLNDLATKLALFASTPGVDVSMSSQNDKVIVACSNRGDFLVLRQIKNWRRKELELRAVREAERSFIRLVICGKSAAIMNNLNNDIP